MLLFKIVNNKVCVFLEYYSTFKHVSWLKIFGSSLPHCFTAVNLFCFVDFIGNRTTYIELDKQRSKRTKTKSKITKGKRHKRGSWSHAGYPP